MESKKNPTCPYCGREMELMYEPHDPFGELSNDDWCYWCKSCDAYAPTDETEESALEEALRRPPQKPIDKDTLFNNIFVTPCWIEAAKNRCHDRGWGQLYPDVLDADSSGYYGRLDRARKRTEPTHYYIKEEYGKTWRCWLTHPTDEERKDVAWEEYDG